MILPISISLLVFLSVEAQPGSTIGDRIKTLQLSDTITAVAIDRTGDFYALTGSGQIQRFDRDGDLRLLYKAVKPPTLFDPRDGARMFAYYRDEQTYQFLNPSFEPIASYKVDAAFAIQPWLVCPSGEYKLWMLDQVDQSLKKVDVKDSKVEVEVWIDSTLIEEARAFTALREYQNFLFALAPGQGIFVFNTLGQQIKTIGTPPIQTFNFLGEELYYLQGDTIHFFNLFTATRRQLKIDPGYNDVLLTDERLILFTRTGISIYAFRP